MVKLNDENKARMKKAFDKEREIDCSLVNVNSVQEVTE